MSVARKGANRENRSKDGGATQPRFAAAQVRPRMEDAMMATSAERRNIATVARASFFATFGSTTASIGLDLISFHRTAVDRALLTTPAM